MDDYHKPVLLNEVLRELDPKPGEVYLDATLGGGGHFAAVLRKMENKGKLIGMDGDRESIEYVVSMLSQTYKFEAKENTYSHKSKDLEILIINDNFVNFEKYFTDFIDVVLADLGLSSKQIDSNELGLSFKTKAELDMRMSKGLGVKASDLLNALPEKELAKLMFEYGEEKNSNRIAKEIINCRRRKRIENTFELYQIVQKVVPYKEPKQVRKAAQRVFQAFRIAVNDELRNLNILLQNSYERLNDDGRIGVISFHSLEDRIVKQFAKSLSKSKAKLILPTIEEQVANTRSTSAKFRVINKSE